MCRPLYEVPIESELDQAPTPASTTMATTTVPATIAPAITPNSAAPTPGPGKIQKASRRQSNLQAAPENIARALETISKADNKNPENGVSHSLPSYVSHNQSLPAYRSLDQQRPALIQHQTFDMGATTTPQSNGCCSGKANTQPSSEPIQSQGPCCRKQEPNLEQDIRAKAELGENGNTHPSTVNGLAYTPFPAPSVLPWQNFHASGHSNMVQPIPVHQSHAQTPTYVPPYQLPHPAMGFPYRNISHNIEFSQPAMPTFPSSQPQGLSYTSTASEGDAGHVCHCGDSCQCLGCASHPFNNTTKQHVQEMGLIVGMNGEEQSQHTPYSTHATSTPLDYFLPGMNYSLDTGAQPRTMHPYPGHAHSHNIGNGYPPHASYAPDQHLMEPSQYYTLEYSVGMPNPCSNATGSCQCGNDCSCVGCLTHSGHNGFDLGPVSAEPSGFYTSGSLAKQTSPDLKDFPAPSPSL